MLKRARKYGRNKCDFIISGEVLGQRPMSQHRGALNLIEKKPVVKGICITTIIRKLLTPHRA